MWWFLCPRRSSFKGLRPLFHRVNLPSCVARRSLCHKVNLPSCVARQPLCHKVNLPRCEARRRHMTPNHTISVENIHIMIHSLNRGFVFATLTFKICHNHIYLYRSHPSASTATCTPSKHWYRTHSPRLRLLLVTSYVNIFFHRTVFVLYLYHAHWRWVQLLVLKMNDVSSETFWVHVVTSLKIISCLTALWKNYYFNITRRQKQRKHFLHHCLFYLLLFIFYLYMGNYLLKVCDKIESDWLTWLPDGSLMKNSTFYASVLKTPKEVTCTKTRGMQRIPKDGTELIMNNFPLDTLS